MSAGANEPRRAPELRVPYPLLEYVYGLPGDYAKLLLRLLQRAQWVPKQLGDVALDAGELLVSLRSQDVWGPVRLDRGADFTESGRVSLLRRVLSRLERDGLIAVRPARESDTAADARSNTRRDTPATVIRFLKYRDSLWPANVDATRETAQAATRGATQQTGAIPSRDPADPSTQIHEADNSTDRGLARVMDIGEARARRPRPDAPTSTRGASGSPLWDAVLASLTARIRRDSFERWFAPLRPSEVGRELLLQAPDRYHLAFVEDNYRELLETTLAHVAPREAEGPVTIRFVPPPESATSPTRS